MRATAASVVARYKAAADRLEIGKWYVQRFGTGDTLYFVPRSEQKNGGWAGILVRHDEGSRGAPKASKTSVPKLSARLWTVIAESDVPDKVKDSAKNK